MVNYGQKLSITVKNVQLRSKTVKNGQLGGGASNSEHLPVFRAPREGNGRMHQSTDEGRMHQSTDAKKSHGKGTDTETDGRTSRLLDRIGPVGRFGENQQFPCAQCGKAFTSLADLKKHHNSHAEIKPFGCNQCGKAFSQACNLKRHKNSQEKGLLAALNVTKYSLHQVS